jgi:hypothetical protein
MNKGEAKAAIGEENDRIVSVSPADVDFIDAPMRTRSRVSMPAGIAMRSLADMERVRLFHWNRVSSIS